MNRRGELSAARLAGQGIPATPQAWRRTLATGDPANQVEAAFLLGEATQGELDPATIDALTAALTSASARIRVEVAYALARHGDAPDARAVLEHELRGAFFADAPVRAAWALAQLGDPRGYPRVIEALHSELPSIRMEAVAVLPEYAALADPHSDPPIDPVTALTCVLDDPEEMLRADARAALDRLAGTG